MPTIPDVRAPSGAVVVRAARKAYGDRVALDGMDLQVRPGTVHGLLGPNGAGKTTLLRAMLGLVRLDGGTLEVGGTVGGFVEAPGAYGYLTGRQNLTLLAGLDDVPGDVGEVLRQVGLEERADTRVSGWSLGMRQRLGIAAGLLRRPDVLELDEPTNGLDPPGAQALRELVRGLTANGLTVLLCSHDLPEVDALCSEVTIVLRGRVAWSGPTDRLRARSGPARCTTSDDAAAAGVTVPGLQVHRHPAGGLVLDGPLPAVDTWVLALAARGVAVRELAREQLPLEQAFLELVA